jgi:hypothetical protein
MKMIVYKNWALDPKTEQVYKLGCTCVRPRRRQGVVNLDRMTIELIKANGELKEVR